jgi:hypothetical protein
MASPLHSQFYMPVTLFRGPRFRQDNILYVTLYGTDNKLKDEAVFLGLV